jgi:hypothetical protein
MCAKKKSEATEKGYKKLLLECLALRKKGGKSAYQRIIKLVEVFNDDDFRLDNGSVDDLELGEILDQYLEDIILDGEGGVFWKLKAMLDEFPDEEHWSEGKLRTMYVEMMNQRKKKRIKETQPRNTATIAEVADLKAQLRAEKARNRRLQKENATLKQKLRVATREITRLKAA